MKMLNTFKNSNFVLKNYKINKFMPNIFNKYFSQINLVTHSGNVDRSINDNFNKKVNWELAKVWLNPQNNSYWNQLDAVKSGNKSDDNVIIAPATKVGQLEFDRFTRKMGIVISRDDNVYIQDGLLKDKKVRIVSSNKSDAQNATSILEKKDKFDNPDVYVIYLTNNEEIGTHKRFVFYDNKNRIVLANTTDVSKLASVVEGIEKEKPVEAKEPAK